MAEEITKQDLLAALLLKQKKKLVRTLQSTVHRQTSGLSLHSHGLIGLGIKHGLRGVVGARQGSAARRFGSDGTGLIQAPTDFEGPLGAVTKKLDQIITILKGDTLEKKEETEEQNRQFEDYKKHRDQKKIQPAKTAGVGHDDSPHSSINSPLLGVLGKIAASLTMLVPAAAALTTLWYNKTNVVGDPGLGFAEKALSKLGTLGGMAAKTKFADSSIGNVFDAFKSTKALTQPIAKAEKRVVQQTQRPGGGWKSKKEIALELGVSEDSIVIASGRAAKKGAQSAEKAAGKAVAKATEKSVAKIAGNEAIKASSVVGKAVLKESGKLVGKGIGKLAAKALPGVGLALGGLFAYERAKDKDYLGAGLELTSGVASLIPGIGTLVALTIDSVLLARDLLKKDKGGMDVNTKLRRQAADAVSNDESQPKALRQYSALTQQGEELTSQLRDQQKKIFADADGSNYELFMKLKKNEKLTETEMAKAKSSGLLDLFESMKTKEEIDAAKLQLLSQNPNLQSDLEAARGSKFNELTNTLDKTLKGFSQREVKEYDTVAGPGGIPQGRTVMKYFSSTGEELTPDEVQRLKSLSPTERDRLQSGKTLEPVGSPALDRKSGASQEINKNVQSSPPIVVQTVDNSRTNVSSAPSAPTYVTPAMSNVDRDINNYFSNYSSSRPTH